MCLFLVRVKIRFYSSTPCMKIVTICLNCPVDTAALPFVCSSLTIGIGYSSFLRLCDAAFLNTDFLQVHIPFLFSTMNIFFQMCVHWFCLQIGRFTGQTVMVVIIWWHLDDRVPQIACQRKLCNWMRELIPFAFWGCLYFFKVCIKRQTKVSEAEFTAWCKTYKDDWHQNFEANSRLPSKLHHDGVTFEGAWVQRATSKYWRHFMTWILGRSLTLNFQSLRRRVSIVSLNVSEIGYVTWSRAIMNLPPPWQKSEFRRSGRYERASWLCY